MKVHFTELTGAVVLTPPSVASFCPGYSLPVRLLPPEAVACRTRAPGNVHQEAGLSLRSKQFKEEQSTAVIARVCWASGTGLKS